MARIPDFFPDNNKRIYDDQLNQSLQESISDNGFSVPNQETSSIVTLSADMPNGTIWYDSDTDELKAKVGGSVVVIQVV